MTRRPGCWKSPTSRVATAKLLRSAMLAIWQSVSLGLCPCAVFTANICAQIPADSSSKGRMRPAKSCLRWISISDARVCLRLPSGSSRIPNSNSNRVVDARNRLLNFCLLSQAMQTLLGFGPSGSETTFVSRMITLSSRNQVALRHHRSWATPIRCRRLLACARQYHRPRVSDLLQSLQNLARSSFSLLPALTARFPPHGCGGDGGPLLKCFGL
jgi:hypothetical protein